MKIKTFKLRYWLIIASVLFSVSCKKFVDIPPPKTQAVSASVFASDATATSAVVGLYDQITTYNQTFLNGAVTVYAGLSADELNNLSANEDFDAFRTNAVPADNNTINSTIWKNAYSYIYQTNAVLEGLDQSTGVSAATEAQLTGEMLFSRSLNYFYLVNLFGAVPLEDTTDYTLNSRAPRTDSAKIYTQMVADLLRAKSLLVASFGTTDNTRPTEMAAAALLSRVYLYQRQWGAAESAATEVINSGAYQLEPDLNQVFLNTSAETIFQLARQNNNTSEGNVFIPGSGSILPLFALTSTLLDAFEAGDQRKADWVNSNTVNGQTYYYPYKYKARNSDALSEYYVVLRLAEVYLVRAEARAEQNNITGALADLNMIRNRAGLPSSLAANTTDLLSAIRQERRVELFAEWGHRWLDLKRTGMANQVLSVYKGAAWQATDVLYPIPFSQIQSNPFLTQNPGYQ